MTVEKALEPIAPVVGTTTLIAGLMSGDTKSIGEKPKRLLTLQEAREKLAATKKAQDNCDSDWAYWGYEGTLAYQRAMVSILEAAELSPELPDVEPPDVANKVVMDACSAIEQYGETILRLAKKRVESKGGPQT